MCSCVRPLAEVIAVVGNKWCKAIVGYLVMAFKESSYDAFTLMSCQVYICIYVLRRCFLTKAASKKASFYVHTRKYLYISISN